MNILIIGGGGREHAIAWKVAQSASVNKVFVAPGNAGTALENKMENVNIAVTDITALLTFAKENQIHLTIVGPEAALAAGIVDAFQQAELKCFGPTKAAAQLEISKSFSKDFMQQHQIPTAQYASFTDKNKALDYLAQQSLPIVIKADGLAAGKGVVIAKTTEQATTAIESMLEGNAFGDAGHKIIIEEFLDGEELSFIVMADGKNVLPLASSQDHKKRDEGDKGPNTGGMGAYSPSPLLTKALNKKILAQVIHPTIKALSQQGTPYTGFLYAGLMITKTGDIKVLEFNCRLGDPETQPILMRLKSDLAELCLQALKGELDDAKIKWDPRPALTVVLAADGYPLDYKKGNIILGLDKINHQDTKIFHAGTTLQNNHVVTNGGRVLAVTALGNNLQLAQTHAYAMAEHIHWDGCFFRSDIGWRGVSAK